jgi:hypothetical protein
LGSERNVFPITLQRIVGGKLGADFGGEIERRTSDVKLILETANKHGVPVEVL